MDFIDYRRLNSILITLPNTQGRQLDRQAGKSQINIYIGVDRGILLISHIQPQNRDKMAFVMPFGKYIFFPIPFGLKGVPTTFQ